MYPRGRGRQHTGVRIFIVKTIVTLVICCKLFFIKRLLNTAKSEQSSHTPGSSHQRPYNFNSLERKKNGKIKGLISNMWLILLYTVHRYILSYLMFVSTFKILGQVLPEKSLMKISILITLD